MRLQLEFYMPVRTISEANVREHWRKKHKRKKQQQETTRLAWLTAPHVGTVTLPCIVRLTRIGSRCLDSDNLAGSFKHVQDAIASEIGVDDGSELIRFEYAQEAIGKRQYEVKVEVYRNDTQRVQENEMVSADIG